MAQSGTLILGQYKVIRVLKLRENYAAVQAVDILDRQQGLRLLNIYEGAAARRYAQVFLDIRHCPEFLGTRLDGESLIALFAHSKLEKAASLGAEAISGGSLTPFELECDNAVTAQLKSAKLMSYGPESVVAYVAAVENEITAVRMILTGFLDGIDSARTKERLRDTYA